MRFWIGLLCGCVLGFCVISIGHADGAKSSGGIFTVQLPETRLLVECKPEPPSPHPSIVYLAQLPSGEKLECWSAHPDAGR